jgi:hypothetical protein
VRAVIRGATSSAHSQLGGYYVRADYANTTQRNTSVAFDVLSLNIDNYAIETFRWPYLIEMDRSDTHQSSRFFSSSSNTSEHFTWNDYPVDSDESRCNKRPVEVELESLLIDHGPSEDSVGLIAARHPDVRPSLYARLRNGWIRSRKRKDYSNCAHVNRSKRCRRALRFTVLVLAVATGVYLAL